MSHFRDRVILPGSSRRTAEDNIPQLPSGRRAITNIPMLRHSVAVAAVSGEAPVSIDKTHALDSLVVTHTRSAP
jgi:hypothetical protein